MDENLIDQRRHLAFHEQGSVWLTGNKADIAIVGPGFLLLRRPEDGKLYATRAGAFNLDADGYLVSRAETLYPVTELGLDWHQNVTAFDATIGGLRLQGYCESGLNRVGDIRIDDAGRPATTSPKASLAGWTIDRQGKINVELPDGSCYVPGQVLLQQFADPYALKCTEDAPYPTRIVYGNPETALPFPAMAAPGTAGMGNIQSECLEIVVLGYRPVLLPTRSRPWFIVTGVPEGHCLIEASADLKTWNPHLVCDLDSFGRGEFSPVAETGLSTRALVSENTFPPAIEPTPGPRPPKAFFRVTQLP
jgi:flagellar hook protein FlgE